MPPSTRATGEPWFVDSWMPSSMSTRIATVTVYGILHTSRDPGKWRERLRLSTLLAHDPAVKGGKPGIGGEEG